MSLSDDFLLFLFLKVCNSYFVIVKPTGISLVAYKLNLIHMNNQEKLAIRSSKLKVPRAKSQTISSYPVRFSTENIFSSVVLLFIIIIIFVLFCFLFCLLVLFPFSKLEIYSLIYIRLYAGGWVIKNIHPVHFQPGLRGP